MLTSTISLHRLIAEVNSSTFIGIEETFLSDNRHRLIYDRSHILSIGESQKSMQILSAYVFYCVNMQMFTKKSHMSLMSALQLLPLILLCFHTHSAKFAHGLNGKAHQGCEYYHCTLFICKAVLNNRKECGVWSQMKFSVPAHVLTNLPCLSFSVIKWGANITFSKDGCQDAMR